jgi:catalase
MLAILNQVDGTLAKKVGDNLGLTPSKTLDELTIQFAKHNHPEYPIKPKTSEIDKSEALSMSIAAGEGTIATRKIAFMVADGFDSNEANKMQNALEAEGAEAVYIAPTVGVIKDLEGNSKDIQKSLLTEASVCYDAIYTPGGKSVKTLAGEPDYIQFLNEMYRHCKALAFEKDAENVLKETYINHKVKVAGIILASQNDIVKEFIHCMKGHRVWGREMSRKVPV